MLTTRGRTAAVGLLAAVSLSVTGCSGGPSNGTATDKIAGADSAASTSAKPTASTSAGKDAPTFDFPPDIKVTVEKRSTGDATKDAILRDLAYSAQANTEAFAKGNGHTVNMSRYFAVPALTFWVDRVAKVRKDGLTLTGDYRFFDFEVTDVANGRTAAARYCEDERRAYGKEIKTGKVRRTQPSAKDFILNTFQVEKDARGDWQVVHLRWQKGDASCVQG